jgi:hypothetical protein
MAQSGRHGGMTSRRPRMTRYERNERGEDGRLGMLWKAGLLRGGIVSPHHGRIELGFLPSPSLRSRVCLFAYASRRNSDATMVLSSAFENSHSESG